MKRIFIFLFLWGGLLSLPLVIQAQSEFNLFDTKIPHTYKFENDTLWQEVQIHFLPNKKATVLVNSMHKLNKTKSSISGECKLVKKPKLQSKSAVTDTLMKVTYRSVLGARLCRWRSEKRNFSCSNMDQYAFCET